jgi:hypothetical protein
MKQDVKEQAHITHLGQQSLQLQRWMMLQYVSIILHTTWKEGKIIHFTSTHAKINIGGGQRAALKWSQTILSAHNRILYSPNHATVDNMSMNTVKNSHVSQDSL